MGYAFFYDLDGCKEIILYFRLFTSNKLCNGTLEFAGNLLTQFFHFRSKKKQDQTRDTHNDRKNLTHSDKRKEETKLWVWFSKELYKKTEDAIKDEK